MNRHARALAAALRIAAALRRPPPGPRDGRELRAARACRHMAPCL
jgi:hypothetical protein